MDHPTIENRKFAFCPTLASYDFSRLIVECLFCDRFLAVCCAHESFGGDWYQPEEENRCCHHSCLVFTDGACSNNGRDSAKAGLGITIGTNEEYCWSIAVDDTVDPGASRTNQRAELLASIEGLKKLEAHRFQENHPAPTARHDQKYCGTYVVVTDSDYVVKGITEWFPAWRQRGWRTSEGKQPTNLDLFLKLDGYITSLEQDRVAVGFWHI